MNASYSWFKHNLYPRKSFKKIKSKRFFYILKTEYNATKSIDLKVVLESYGKYLLTNVSIEKSAKKTHK